MKQFYYLELSTNKDSSTASNFILQSKTIQTILELVYRLAEKVEDKSELFTIDVLDMLHDIRLMKELHLQQLSKVANDRTLSLVLDNISPEYRKKIIKEIHQHQEVHNITRRKERKKERINESVEQTP